MINFIVNNFTAKTDESQQVNACFSRFCKKKFPKNYSNQPFVGFTM